MILRRVDEVIGRLKGVVLPGRDAPGGSQAGHLNNKREESANRPWSGEDCVITMLKGTGPVSFRSTCMDDIAPFGPKLKMLIVRVSCLCIIILCATVIVSCGGASPSGTGGSSATEVSLDEQTTLSPSSSPQYSIPEGVAQQWYDSGFYRGFWAGTVETIPVEGAHLPDFFFSAPTPSAPIRTDGSGQPIQKDPAEIKKPLWIFGDEVRVDDYLDQIRQAKQDQRPVLFYATSVADAARALRVEADVDTDAPVERLIVFWLPWDTTVHRGVGTMTWTGSSRPENVMLMLVEASLVIPGSQ